MKRWDGASEGCAWLAERSSIVKNTILYVDDDMVDRRSLARNLHGRYRLVEAATCTEARQRQEAEHPDAAILDYQLPDGDALELLQDLRVADPDLLVVLLTGHGSIELAVEAMRRGANHLFTKPADAKALSAILEHCLAERRNRRRRRAYDANRDRHRPDPFRGESDAVEQLAKRARKVAAGDAPVLLRGETGCGKGVLSRWLHDNGPRAPEPFVELNCAGLKPEFLESELFGHRRGAFTGAVESKKGMLEVADRGTVFLDEVTEMDLGIQAKLLKVLEEKTFRPLGGVREQRVDVRLIAATGQRVERLVRARLFRKDLFFRISTLPLEIPPLRRRSEDVPSLADYYLERLGRKLGHAGAGLSPAARDKLVRYKWPGNIRELRNVLERALMLADGDTLEPGDLQFEDGMYLDVADSVGFSLEEMEKRHIQRVLDDEVGAVDRAAERLGIPRSSLYKKIKKYRLRS